VAYVSGGQGQSLTGQATAQDIASIDPNIVNAVQSGNASWTFDDAGQGYLYDKSTGLALPGATVRDLGNGQIAIQMGSGNNIIQAQATTKEDGSINPVSASDVYTAKFTPYAKDAFADLGSNLIKVGLAYALPILGEAIAAELAVSAATGTALAAVGTGVAQGKSLEEAIKSAAPALIAGNVISASGLSDLTGRIASSPDMQNVINNVATSTVKTAISGGSVNDILNSAIASGGGTLIGQSLTDTGVSPITAQAVGQGITTSAITGDLGAGVLSGATSAAGGLGSAQAKENALARVQAKDNVASNVPSTTPPSTTNIPSVSTSVTPVGTDVVGQQPPLLPLTPSTATQPPVANVTLTTTPATATSPAFTPTSPGAFVSKDYFNANDPLSTYNIQSPTDASAIAKSLGYSGFTYNGKNYDILSSNDVNELVSKAATAAVANAPKGTYYDVNTGGLFTPEGLPVSPGAIIEQDPIQTLLQAATTSTAAQLIYQKLDSNANPALYATLSQLGSAGNKSSASRFRPARTGWFPGSWP
jgi:hypothetical protein